MWVWGDGEGDQEGKREADAEEETDIFLSRVTELRGQPLCGVPRTPAPLMRLVQRAVKWRGVRARYDPQRTRRPAQHRTRSVT